MAITEKNTFHPDYVIHPGEVLKETLEARGIRIDEFAAHCAIDPETVSQIIGGKQVINPETAMHFSRVLGVSENIWNNLSAMCRTYKGQTRVD